VKNLDTEVSLDEFSEIFARFGRITSAVIATDENGNSKVSQKFNLFKGNLLFK